MMKKRNKTEKLDDVLSELIVEHFNYDYEEMGNVVGIIDISMRQMLKHDVLPREGNFKKLMKSDEIPDTYKKRIALACVYGAIELKREERQSSVGTEYYTKNYKFNKQELAEIKQAEFQVNFPKDISFYKNKFSELLDKQYMQEDSGFYGFLKELHEVWERPDTKAMAEVINLYESHLYRVFNDKYEDSKKLFREETINKVLSSELVEDNDSNRFKLTKLANGNGKDLKWLQKKLQEASDVMAAEYSDQKEKSQAAKEYIAQAMNFAGVNHQRLTKSIGSEIRDKGKFYSSFTRGARHHDPERVFNLAETLFYCDEIFDKDFVNNSAAVILGLPEYKDKAQIKDEFMSGDMQVNEMMLYTRVLHSKKSALRFKKEELGFTGNQKIYGLYGEESSKIRKKIAMKIGEECLGVISEHEKGMFGVACNSSLEKIAKKANLKQKTASKPDNRVDDISSVNEARQRSSQIE